MIYKWHPNDKYTPVFQKYQSGKKMAKERSHQDIWWFSEFSDSRIPKLSHYKVPVDQKKTVLSLDEDKASAKIERCIKLEAALF